MTLRLELLLFVGLAGCRTLQSQPEIPAIVVHPTVASHAALERAVADELGLVNVSLDDEAFTQSSEISLEPTHVSDPSGRIVPARAATRPNVFRLVKIGGRCVLVHERTGRRIELADTDCEPRP